MEINVVLTSVFYDPESEKYEPQGTSLNLSSGSIISMKTQKKSAANNMGYQDAFSMLFEISFYISSDNSAYEDIMKGLLSSNAIDFGGYNSSVLNIQVTITDDLGEKLTYAYYEAFISKVEYNFSSIGFDKNGGYAVDKFTLTCSQATGWSTSAIANTYGATNPSAGATTQTVNFNIGGGS